MTKITNPASPGSPQQVTAESPIRAPLLGSIPWSNHAAHPAVVMPVDRAGWPPRDQHVRPYRQQLSTRRAARCSASKSQTRGLPKLCNPRLAIPRDITKETFQ